MRSTKENAMAENKEENKQTVLHVATTISIVCKRLFPRREKKQPIKKRLAPWQTVMEVCCGSNGSKGRRNIFAGSCRASSFN